MTTINSLVGTNTSGRAQKAHEFWHMQHTVKEQRMGLGHLVDQLLTCDRQETQLLQLGALVSTWRAQGEEARSVLTTASLSAAPAPTSGYESWIPVIPVQSLSGRTV